MHASYKIINNIEVTSIWNLLSNNKKKVHLLILCVYNCFIKYAGVFYGSGNFFWSRLPRKYRHKACLNNTWSNLLSHDTSQFSQTSDFANMQFAKCSHSFCVIAWSVCWGLFHKHNYYLLHSLQRLMIVTNNEKSLLCTLRNINKLYIIYMFQELRANLETSSLLFPISGYIPGFNPRIRSYFAPNQKFV